MSQPPRTLNQADLPRGMVVLERGWLSSNNIFFSGPQGCALVDSGYVGHSAQTLALVAHLLAGRPLGQLLNTHLHSDHCGGNAALQARYPELRTAIPPGLSEQVRQWDPVALSYGPTGQECPRFVFQTVLQPGRTIWLGEHAWEIHSAPGHDPDSVMLFEPQNAVLLSADALWGNGFGVVFPELDGADAFETVGRTLDLIEQLRPRIVVPGHGPAFDDVAEALGRARSRLAQFMQSPHKHARYAAKVLLKFKLLAAQSLSLTTLYTWAQATTLLTQLHAAHPSGQDFQAWLLALLDELVLSGAASKSEGWAHNA